MRLDLRELETDRVIDVVFNHEVEEDSWWWTAEFEFDPTPYAAQIEFIFRNAEALLSRYSREQVEQGIWFFTSAPDVGLEDLLWHTRIPWSSRASLIESTVDLYRNLFARDLLDTSAHMFWDSLAYGFCVPTRHPESNQEDQLVQNGMFAAMRQSGRSLCTQPARFYLSIRSCPE